MRLLDVVGRRREDVEREQAARHQQVVGCAERGEPLGVVVRQVEVRPERAGDERDPLRHRRPAEVPEPEVEELRDAGRVGAVAADVEHPGRGVDADHGHPRLRDRDGDPPGADAELDDGRPGRHAPRPAALRASST